MLSLGINATGEMTGQSFAVLGGGAPEFGDSVDVSPISRLAFSKEPSVTLSVIILVIVLLGLSGLRVANQYQRAVVLRLGRFQAIRGPGLYWIIPVIPESMQRAIAQEAEALREKRARLIKAQAELEAAEQLRRASEIIMQNPAGLELRRMQMITEVGAEQNTMTIVMMPSEFVAMARGIAEMVKRP